MNLVVRGIAISCSTVCPSVLHRMQINLLHAVFVCKDRELSFSVSSGVQLFSSRVWSSLKSLWSFDCANRILGKTKSKEINMQFPCSYPRWSTVRLSPCLCRSPPFWYRRCFSFHSYKEESFSTRLCFLTLSVPKYATESHHPYFWPNRKSIWVSLWEHIPHRFSAGTSRTRNQIFENKDLFAREWSNCKHLPWWCVLCVLPSPAPSMWKQTVGHWGWGGEVGAGSEARTRATPSAAFLHAAQNCRVH